MKKIIITLFCSLLGNVSYGATTGNIPSEFKEPSVSAPLAFTENKGQVHDQYYKPRPDILYGVMAGNMAVHIKKSGISYQLYRVDKYKETINVESLFNNEGVANRKEVEQQTIYRIDLAWLNYNPNFTRLEDEALLGYANYYSETCPEGALHVKSYKGVTLKNLYKGINLHYYEKKGELKHDYIVAPHADYKQIHIRLEGAEVNIGRDGSLLLNTPLGKVMEGAPIVYQNGKQLVARWVVENNVLSFEIGDYNPALGLIIDPVTRLWGTFYGGNIDDWGNYACTDAFGNSYIAGYTNTSGGTAIATVGSHQSTFNGGITLEEAFLAKFDANGVRLWGTYYGGGGNDYGQSCATDASGNVFLVGYSSSSGTVIATPASHQPSATATGVYDAFLAKFDPNGIRLWGTFYGGTGFDRAYGCATDGSGNVYMCGHTGSFAGTEIATVGSHQPAIAGGGLDAFLVKFNTNGVRQWGTYYGANPADEEARSCATDASGNIFMAGTLGGQGSTGTVIATPGSHQTAFGGNTQDAFLVKFDPNGQRLWGTYYGGTGLEYGYSCATDPSGNVHLAGYTTSTANIASSGSHQSSYGGSNFDAYLIKFDANGVRQWGTYYGGAGLEYCYACATDVNGNIYLTGGTNSTGTVIATPGSHQPVNAGNYDVFLVKFNAGGIRQWGTFYGGIGNEYGNACPTDLAGHVFLEGYTLSNTGFSTPGSHQFVWGTGADGFLAKFDACDVAPAQPSTIDIPAVVCDAAAASYSTPVAFGASSYTWSLPGGWSGAGNSNIISASPGSSGIFTLVVGNKCGVSPTQTVNVTVNPTPTVTLSSGSICAGQAFTLLASGANSYSYSGGPIVSPSISTSYTVIGSNTSGCSNSVVATVTVHSTTVTVNSGVICHGQSFTITPAGASTYTYSSGPVVTPLVTSSYSVIGTSSLGCVSTNTAVSNVVVNSNPTITVNSGTICEGASFTIVPGGAAVYTIQGGLSVVSPGTSTSYSVVGKSTTGCISANTVISNVNVNPVPVINISTNKSVLCRGEEATLTVSGASNYTIEPGVGTNPVISPTITSTYSVTAVGANGCSKTQVFSQAVDECLGIVQSAAGSRELAVYPNPTNGIINIELETEKEVSITNAIGQVVYSSKLCLGRQSLDIGDLPKGIYILQARNALGSQAFKIIKE